MGKSHSHNDDYYDGGHTNHLSSCIIATIFLLLLLAAPIALYFTIFKPQNPKLSVTAVQIPSFSTSAANTSATFTFSLYAAVTNPNRAALRHYDSSLQLLRGGAQVGLLFVPAGKIGPGRTIHIAATFKLRDFPVGAGSGLPEVVGPVGPGVEMETRMEVVGRVRVVHFFTHHVEARLECTVAIGVSDGSVLGFRC